VKTKRFIYLLGAVVISLAVVSGGSAFASSGSSSRAVPTKAQWSKEIAKIAAPGSGCYHASFPSLTWHATRCLVAPAIPLVPNVPRGGPEVIGNGADYLAHVSGTISQATGTFDDVSSGITEKGQINDTGPQVSNAFTLQLNTEFFNGAACKKAKVPADCAAWQQFIYAFHYSGSTNEVFMQYWLLYYDTTCPSGWYTYADGSYTFCYTNSPATSYGLLKAGYLKDTSLVAAANTGGNDSVTVSSTQLGASTASNPDTKVDLGASWDGTEWGVFGDAGGGQANFGAHSVLAPQTSFVATSSSAPTCEANSGTTGETNNLDLTKTPALGAESSPTMVSKQTNNTPKTASCATKA
jgi:hypothetical protein